ncbi:hypothetical protein [Mucisphaera sp.]|uniref:hypothetical protein n=1 Tax=Mucisphaera sp. TaxID=2913024 RepID=UPI003D1345E9
MRRLAAIILSFTLTAPAHASLIVNLVGDMDNFGFDGPLRVDFFDNREPDDLPVFDAVINDDGTTPRAWQHDFTDQLDQLANAPQLEVHVDILEVFSVDIGVQPTISIDGILLPFGNRDRDPVRPELQRCTFTGPEAEFVRDGIVQLELFENGDNLAIDFSRITINQIPEPASLFGLSPLLFLIHRFKQQPV